MPAGLISAVAAGSLAERAGLRSGDELISINGHRLRDAIDVRFHAGQDDLVLEVRRSWKVFCVEVERRYGEALGLTFAEPIFEETRRCDNRCEFCFVAQMPPGLRPSVYVRDDDYRLSFLGGSYITLTNLCEADWERIAEQYLSPLYVSVHTTDSALRRDLLRNPDAPDVLGQLGRLAEMGISTHTQIVVLPGLNDGPVLERSIGELSELYPAVRSISVVPVGLTRFHRGGCRVPTASEMGAVLGQVSRLQSEMLQWLGVHLVYLSDEWYLGLGEAVPPIEAYDGLDLTENGVGLVRRFLDTGWPRLRRLFSGFQSAALVTGSLFAPTLAALAAESPVEVVPITNAFLGETVTVAGLLTGQDVLAALRDRVLGDVVVLPGVMFAGPEGRSLDGMRSGEIGEAVGRQIVVGAVEEVTASR